MSETVRSIWDDQILPIETVSISSDTNPHRGEKKAGRGQGRGGGGEGREHRNLQSLVILRILADQTNTSSPEWRSNRTVISYMECTRTVSLAAQSQYGDNAGVPGALSGIHNACTFRLLHNCHPPNRASKSLNMSSLPYRWCSGVRLLYPEQSRRHPPTDRGHAAAGGRRYPVWSWTWYTVRPLSRPTLISGRLS